MKNIFSFKLYLQGLRKVRTAGVAMAIVITVSNALFPVLNMISSGRDLGEFDRAPEIDSILFAPFGWLVILFAPLLVYNMFSYLNERKSSDFFHALPQKRICIYISFMFAVFTWIVGVLVLTTLVNMLLWVTLTIYVLNATAVVMTFLGFLILGLAMAGFMALAMMLTGTATANWLVFLLFFLFVPVCGEFFLSRFQTMVPMFNSDCSWFRIFEVEFFLPLSLFLNPLLYNWGLQYSLEEQGLPFLYWFAVAIVLFALSAVAYCRRRSESATKSAPNRFMQHIYRIGVTFPFILYGAYQLIYAKKYMYPYNSKLGLQMLLIGLLVWVIFELLTTKKVKNLLKTLPLFVLTAVLAVGGVGSLYVAKNIFYATTPERDSIESAILDVSNRLSGWEEVLFSEVEIKDANVLDQVYEAIEETKEYWQTPWDERAKLPFNSKITLTLRSGRKVKYDLRSSFDLYMTFYRSEEHRKRRLAALDFDVEKIQCNYVEENSMQIWEAFKSDFEALDDVQKLNYLEWNKGQYSSIHVWGIYENHRFQQGYSVSSEYMPNAYRLYIKYYLESQQNSLEDLQARLMKDDFDNIFYANMNIVKAGSGFSIDCHSPELICAFLQSIALDSHLLDVEKAANKEIYKFKLKVIWADKENQFEYTDGVDVQMYLTFSAEDFEIYRQIVANKGALPVS